MEAKSKLESQAERRWASTGWRQFFLWTHFRISLLLKIRTSFDSKACKWRSRAKLVKLQFSVEKQTAVFVRPFGKNTARDSTLGGGDSPDTLVAVEVTNVGHGANRRGLGQEFVVVQLRHILGPRSKTAADQSSWQELA